MRRVDLKRAASRMRPGKTEASESAPARPAAPKFVSDLYADLRDSHMLLPAAALLVAILAVPILFAGGSESVPTAAPAPIDDATTTRVAPAVFAKQTGIRNYQQRLEALRRRDPFKQRYSNSKNEGEAQVAVGAGEPSPDPSVSVAGSGSSATTGPTPGSPEISVGEPDQPSASLPTPAGPAPPATQRLVTYRIDVAVGRVGDVKKRNGVSRLTPLPFKRVPIAVFLGVSENGKRASFMLSSDVADTNGDGVCIGPADGQCEVLTMKPGDTRYLIYGPRERRYRLRLREIVVKERKLDGDHPAAQQRPD